MLELISGVIGCFVAIACFAVLLECPRRYLPLAGIVGAAGGGVYLLSVQLKTGIVMASFFSALVIAFMSHAFARIFRAPVTIFLIPGILPTVPGAGMYRTVYYLIAGESVRSSYNLIQTLEIAGVIALAIFIMGTIFTLQKKLIQKKEKDAKVQRLR